MTQPLADSTLEIVDQRGLVVVSNDDWNNDVAARAYFQTQTSLRPSNATDAAALVSLAPGTYTVIIRGKHGASGTALAEVNTL